MGNGHTLSISEGNAGTSSTISTLSGGCVEDQLWFMAVCDCRSVTDVVAQESMITCTVTDKKANMYSVCTGVYKYTHTQ